jgi:hypothetical protein
LQNNIQIWGFWKGFCCFISHNHNDFIENNSPMKTLQNKTKTDAQREEQKTVQPKTLQQMLHQPQDHSAILQYMKNQRNPAYHAPILQAVQQFKAKNGLIVQRNDDKIEEEDLQMKKDETVQRNEEDDELQLKAAPIQKQENKTGLPDNLKSGIENLSGYSMDDVKVHYNSDKPAQLHAHAYAQGTEIHIASGQEKHLPHEVWHVVQQKQGRVQPTMQMKGNVNINDNAGLEKEADVMGAKAVQGKFVCRKNIIKPIKHTKLPLIQCYVGDYKPDTTLASTTKAMRGLNLQQRKVIQNLHEDTNKSYTIEEARNIATGNSSTSNPYEWEVTGIGNNYVTPDVNIQNILDNFGHPTQSVVKLYDDLASRVGFDVGKNRKGTLDPSTIKDLHLHFEASKPLHLGQNDFLRSTWQDNLDSYTGSKTGIPLYSVERSQLTKDFSTTKLGNASLNDILKGVSTRPFELHHLLFKAHHPDLATSPLNLMLTERSERESVYGPGQHELMHMVASGNHKDKFNELLPQYTDEYNKWIKQKSGKNLI